MLLGIPTGLHFIEVRVQGVRSCLLSTVSSAASPGPAGSSMRNCGTDVATRRRWLRDFRAFLRLFQIPKPPRTAPWVGFVNGNLLCRVSGSSRLSRPSDPPPLRLSAIQINFIYPFSTNESVEAPIKRVENDLRQIADEVARIEREFREAVNVTVLRYPGFRTVLDTLNVRFRYI